MRAWVTAAWMRLLCTLLGARLLRLQGAAYDAGYADGYGHGAAAERRALITDFVRLEQHAPPVRH
jgi:hypothetical protein